MNKLPRIFFLSIIVAFFSATVQAQDSHIENPRFGNSSRFKIVKDENIESLQDKDEAADIDSQKKNPQYQKASHDQNSAVRKYTGTQIQQKHSDNIQEFLSSEGILVMTTGGTGAASNISYKGYAGFCIKVYIDGILANNSTTGEFDWNSIDVSSIEAIEIEDVPPLSVSEFAGCIIRITTRNGGDKLVAGVSAGGYEKNLFDTWCGTFRYDKSFSKFNFNIGANVIFAQNEFELPDNLGTQLYNYSDQGNVSFAWNYRFSENANIYGSDSFSYNKIKANRNSDLNTGIEEDISTRNNINFSYATDKLKSDTSLFYNFSNVRYVNNYLTNNIDDTNFNKISLTENIKWYCDFSVGVDVEFSPSANDACRITEKIGAAKKFTFGTFSVEPQLIAMAWHSGINAGDLKSGFAFLPRLSLGWQGLILATYREFILPTFNQLYWPDTSYAKGNPDLIPESGWSGFVGFKRSDFPLWAQYKISYYGNKIRWGSEGGKQMYVNIGDGIYNVATVGLSLDLFNDILSLNLDGTYTSARLCSTGKQIMWVPEWQAHAGITVRFLKFTLNTDYAFTSNRWTSNDNDLYYPAFHLLNMSAAFDFTQNIQLFVKGTNLLDQRVPYHDNYYMPSRKFSVGVKVSK